MYLYLTSGTAEFMGSLRKKYSKEKMIILYGEGNAVLLHESTKKSFFATPHSYEIVNQINDLNEQGFFVLNHIPVKAESRKIFEDRFIEKVQTIKDEPGFVAFRLLKPLHEEIYISLSEWNGPHSFEAWKASSSYKALYENKNTTNGVDYNNFLTGAPYVRTYISSRPEEEK